MSNTLGDYNLYLVALSYGVSVLGSLIGLLAASFIRQRDGTLHLGWLTLAAILIGGCAIWAMHFLGMIAFNPGTPMAYDTQLTLVSLVIPIVFVLFGLYVAFSAPRSLVASIAAGAITGIAVAAMHYIGMAAVRIAAHVSYDPTLVTLSIIIAMAAAIAALQIVLRFDGVLRYASALIMGVAVCGMHYTGMAALQLEPASIDVNYFDGALTERITGIAVVAVVAIVCGVSAVLAGNKVASELSGPTRSVT